MGPGRKTSQKIISKNRQQTAGIVWYGWLAALWAGAQAGQATLCSGKGYRPLGDQALGKTVHAAHLGLRGQT